MKNGNRIEMLNFERSNTNRVMKNYKILCVVGVMAMLTSCSYKHAYQPIVFSELDTQENYQTLYESYAGGEEKKESPSTKQKELFLAANKDVAIKDVSNVRELGGIMTKDGRVIKSGQFYRSGHLGKLKKKNFATLEQYSISQVIDLRTDKEIKKHPDHLPKSIQYFNYQAFDDSEDRFSKAKTEVLKGRVTVEESNAGVEEFYGIYVLDDPMKIREIIVSILDNEQATLVHCSAGKDRTGMISALILSILNVDRQTILEEYLVSNNERIADVSSRMKLAKFGKILYPKINYEVIENFTWIKPNYLEAMFTAIDAKYGSIDEYIKNGLAISDEQRQAYVEKHTNFLK